MKAELEKISAAMASAKSAAESLVPTDSARTELETAFACLLRARRILRERQLMAQNGDYECQACGQVTSG